MATKAQEKAAKDRGFWGAVKGYAAGALKNPFLKGAVGPVGVGAVALYQLLNKQSSKTQQTTGGAGPGGALWFPTSLNGTAGTQQFSPPTKVAPFKGSYKYNAPMVKNAYFNPLPGIKGDNGIYGSVNLQSYNHAANAWSSSKAAKGAIQMDRYFWNMKTTIEAINAKDKARGKKSNRDMRGFKFLYNPERVTMSWGGNSYTSNEALLQGLEKINPAAVTTSASMLNFSLFLNRIEDMSFIDKYGLIPTVDTAKFKDMDPAQRNRAYSAAFNALNPYPTIVSLDELSDIYEKGTMYDVEWLISTLNGFAFRDHVSDLNGKTNDMGFLMQFPVELHLGNKLRYRVQITDISIEHIIFNQRMVPIWSKVTLTCRRMPDYNLDNALYNAEYGTGGKK